MAVTVFGIAALGFMMAMYACERRGRRFILLFALGCLLSSSYGFLSGAWAFGVVEAIWAGIAVHRYRTASPQPEPGAPPTPLRRSGSPRR
ncbi:MAG: hypothetical protein ABIS47_14955 [Acidimicrobiales bacterium]